MEFLKNVDEKYCKYSKLYLAYIVWKTSGGWSSVCWFTKLLKDSSLSTLNLLLLDCTGASCDGTGGAEDGAEGGGGGPLGSRGWNPRRSA